MKTKLLLFFLLLEVNAISFAQLTSDDVNILFNEKPDGTLTDEFR